MKRLSPLLVLLCLPLASYAPPPAWWSQDQTESRDATRILDPLASENNYGPVNLGQLKNVALKAKLHLDQALPSSGGAGSQVNDVVASFFDNPSADPSQNWQPANLGQLKAVATPFYDRLIAVGYNTKANLITQGYPSTWPYNYPWNPATPASQNYAPVNLGQLKAVFSFEVPLDSDGDGISDTNEAAGGTDANNSDTDGDGVSDAQEALNGTSPTNPDHDGDGLNDGAEAAGGTSPTDPDHDDDGVNDGSDQYPKDARRSQDVPVIKYVAVDFTKSIFGNEYTAFESAIDDQNLVGLLVVKRDAAQIPVEYKTASWTLGQPITGAIQSIRSFLAGEERVATGGGGNPATYRLVVSPSFVSASGTVVGTARTELVDIQVENPAPSPPEWPTSTAPEVLFTWSAGVFTWGGHYQTYRGMKANGATWLNPIEIVGQKFAQYHIQGDGFYYDPEPFEYPDDVLEGGSAMWGIHVVAPNGVAFGRRNYRENPNDFQSPYDQSTMSVWTGSGFYDLFARPDMQSRALALNSAQKIYGFSSRLGEATEYYDDPNKPEGDHPFWWDGQGATDFYFSIPEVFRNQVAFTNSYDSWAIMAENGSLITDAKLLEGTPGGDWVNKLILRKTSPGVELFQVEIAAPPRLINNHLIMASQGLLQIPFEILADTNRNGFIGIGDTYDKDVFRKERGAFYAVNYDADEGRGVPDSVDFNDNGDPVAEDKQIHLPADEPDIAPFRIREMKGLPPDYKVYLKVGEPEDMLAIHLYKQIKAGAANNYLWGGLDSTANWDAGVDITQVVNSNAPGFDDRRVVPGMGDFYLGLEGLLLRGMKVPGNVGTLPNSNGKFSGEIVLRLQIRKADNSVVGEDQIRLRVAPWIAMSHREASEQVWAFSGPENVAFVASAVNGRYTGLGHTGVGSTGTEFKPETNGGLAFTQWFQDHLEFGYTQRPGGPKTHLVFRVPYNFDDGASAQPQWPKVRLLGSTVGMFQIGHLLNDPDPTGHGGSGNFGGNLEVLPPLGEDPLGVILMGDTVTEEMRIFIAAQEFQYKVGKSFQPEASWLYVGHIDEYAAFLPKARVLMASPRQAIELLQRTIPIGDRGKRVFFATSGNTLTGTVTAPTPETDDPLTPNEDETRRIYTGRNHVQLGDQYHYIRFYEGAAEGHVAKVNMADGFVEIRDEQGSTRGIWFTGKTMDAYTSRLRNTTPTGWEAQARPATNDKFVLVTGTKRWPPVGGFDGMPAVITVREVLKDAAFVSFNKFHVQAVIDGAQAAIQNAAGASKLRFVPIPSLFFRRYPQPPETLIGEVAFNPGPANLQPAAGNLYAPRQFGPVNAAGEDIFERAIKNAVQETTYFVDDWELYHRFIGDVHCGSNVKRAIPADPWWKKLH